MTIPRILTHTECYELARKLADTMKDGAACYPIPRGGVPVMYLLGNFGKTFTVVDDPAKADYVVDDLIESGTTMDRAISYATAPRPVGRRFITGREPPESRVLLDKRSEEWKGSWVVFPWEETASKGIEDHFARILQFVGDDPARGGLIETPARVAKAWQFWCKGYGADPGAILKTFEDGAEGCNEMVVVKDIPFYSHCEHHLAAIFGTATIAYIPDGKIVGLSKLNRLVDCFARRLQVQERLTGQIADALVEHLAPKGVGVVVKARHLCMESRGVCQQGHSTVTSALRGAIYEGPARAEFLSLVNG